MSRADTFYMKLHDLIDRWETWLQAVDDRPRPEREQGFIDGFQAAVNEVRTLYAQVYGLPLSEALGNDVNLDIPPSDVPAAETPEWEYLYVTFQKDTKGAWIIDQINGVPSEDARVLGSFTDAVAHLRNQGNWRLTSVAQGIHVFRRPRQR
ncbi:MAG: hypothetical protein ACLFTK_04660 [Anaerolineales bacterium]